MNEKDENQILEEFYNNHKDIINFDKIPETIVQSEVLNNNDYINYTNQIINFYKNFNINLTISKIVDSYSITRYFINLDRTNKTRIANIEKLVDDLSAELNVKNIKFTIDFETGGIVLEVPKKNRKTLNFENVKPIENTGLNVCFGKDLNNNNFIVDICTLPHLLVAGTTGSGKSVFINSILLNLIQNYDEKKLRISLIDPKKVELSLYKNIKHVENFADNLADSKRILSNALVEIDRRYKLLQQNNVRNVENYNKKVAYSEKMAYKLIVIDELADIILQDKKASKYGNASNETSLEHLIVRIAQIGRACGVHLIVATQRPSSDVITGLIKANIPSRVAFSVSSRIDSRIILDQAGAEKLTGKGDMLIKIVGDDELHRVQGAFVTDEQVENITNKYINNEAIYLQYEIEQQNQIEMQKRQDERAKRIEMQKIKEHNDKVERIVTPLVAFFFIFGLLVLLPLSIIFS